MTDLQSGLYIVATPIGNLGDLSKRAEYILGVVDFIICENPNHSLKLLNKLGIKKKLMSLHDYNEKFLIKRIEKFQTNSAIALISDAGSPLISDPGYNLVLDYIEKGIFITSIPGPSAIITALQLSGLPTHNFRFFGFAPKNKKGLESLSKEIEILNITSVLFISGNRLLDFLSIFSNSSNHRKISVCKEITKKNENIIRGNASQIIKTISSDQKLNKGEFVLVFEAKENKMNNKLNDEITIQIKKLLIKFSLTEVVEIVHKLTSISKREIYKAALVIKNV